jgi:hypothetical protein
MSQNICNEKVYCSLSCFEPGLLNKRLDESVTLDESLYVNTLNETVTIGVCQIKFSMELAPAEFSQICIWLKKVFG